MYGSSLGAPLLPAAAYGPSGPSAFSATAPSVASGSSVVLSEEERKKLLLEQRRRQAMAAKRGSSAALTAASGSVLRTHQRAGHQAAYAERQAALAARRQTAAAALAAQSTAAPATPGSRAVPPIYTRRYARRYAQWQARSAARRSARAAAVAPVVPTAVPTARVARLRFWLDRADAIGRQLLRRGRRPFIAASRAVRLARVPWGFRRRVQRILRARYRRFVGTPGYTPASVPLVAPVAPTVSAGGIPNYMIRSGAFQTYATTPISAIGTQPAAPTVTPEGPETEDDDLLADELDLADETPFYQQPVFLVGAAIAGWYYFTKVRKKGG